MNCCVLPQEGHTRKRAGVLYFFIPSISKSNLKFPGNLFISVLHTGQTYLPRVPDGLVVVGAEDVVMQYQELLT
jgi:hypothetical protein